VSLFAAAPGNNLVSVLFVDVGIENFCGLTDNQGVLVLEVFTVSDFKVSFDAVLGLGFGFLFALLFVEE
jgi:hypothetical protein